MSYGEDKHPWSVFDGVKTISIAPEPLMAEINSAIAALEYARVAAFSHSADPALMPKNANKKPASYYDSQIADEAYKSGLASMTAGRVDEAVISLNLALSKCPPEQTSAVSKIQSLISLTSQQRKLSVSNSEAEEAATDFDEENDVFVSAIISKYMETKCKRKSAIGVDPLIRWSLSPEHSLPAQRAMRKPSNSVDGREESPSAGSRLSRCSSPTSYDAFFSVKTCFSRSSSLSKIDLQDFGKQSIIILELFHCEGWPFGLCKKAFLPPPLPKSPSDSWSWRKSGGLSKIHG